MKQNRKRRSDKETERKIMKMIVNLGIGPCKYGSIRVLKSKKFLTHLRKNIKSINDRFGRSPQGPHTQKKIYDEHQGKHMKLVFQRIMIKKKESNKSEK